jgi:hypothetical protein
VPCAAPVTEISVALVLALDRADPLSLFGEQSKGVGLEVGHPHAPALALTGIEADRAPLSTDTAPLKRPMLEPAT